MLTTIDRYNNVRPDPVTQVENIASSISDDNFGLSQDKQTTQFIYESVTEYLNSKLREKEGYI